MQSYALFQTPARSTYNNLATYLNDSYAARNDAARNKPHFIRQLTKIKLIYIVNDITITTINMIIIIDIIVIIFIITITIVLLIKA